MTRFGFDFGRSLISKSGPIGLFKAAWGGLEVDLLWACYLGRIWVAFKTAQEAPKRPPDPPKSTPRASRRPSRGPQEAPRGLQETPRAGQEASRSAQELPRAPEDAHQAFPKHLARQPFSENSKNSNHGSRKHRRRLRSPISMHPKGLASNRKIKKGGRAAVIPLGEVNKLRTLS